MGLNCRPTKEQLPKVYKINHLATRLADETPDGVFEDGKVAIDLKSSAVKKLESLIGYKGYTQKPETALARHWQEVKDLIMEIQLVWGEADSVTQESLKMIRDPGARRRAAILIESAALLLKIMDHEGVCDVIPFYAASPAEIQKEKEHIPTIAQLYVRMGGEDDDGGLPDPRLESPKMMTDEYEMKPIDRLLGYTKDFDPKRPGSPLLANWHMTRKMIRALRDKDEEITPERLQQLIPNPQKRGKAAVIIKSVDEITIIMSSGKWINGGAYRSGVERPAAVPEGAQAVDQTDEVEEREPETHSLREEEWRPPIRTRLGKKDSWRTSFRDWLDDTWPYGMVGLSVGGGLSLWGLVMYLDKRRLARLARERRGGPEKGGILHERWASKAGRLGIHDFIIARKERKPLKDFIRRWERLKKDMGTWIIERTQWHLLDHVDGYERLEQRYQLWMLEEIAGTLSWDSHGKDLESLPEKEISDMMLREIGKFIDTKSTKEGGPVANHISLRPESIERLEALKVLAGPASPAEQARALGIHEDIISEVTEERLGELVVLAKDPTRVAELEVTLALYEHVEAFDAHPKDVQADLSNRLALRWAVEYFEHEWKDVTPEEKSDVLLRELDRLKHERFGESALKIALRERAEMRLRSLRGR